MSSAMMMRPVFLLCALCVTAGALLGCDWSLQHKPGHVSAHPQDSHMADILTFRMGESAAHFAARAGSRLKITRQPAGLDFYAVDWSAPALGTVRLELGQHTFNIEHVFGISTAEDQGALKAEGFFKVSVYTGITPTEFISHDEARLAIHGILQGILQAGWQQVISRSRPRLSGQARLDYCLNVSDSIGLDPRHLPTFTDWMRIPSRTGWSFYADGVYLDVRFTREPTYLDPQKPGAYLLTFNLQTETEYLRGYAGPDHRRDWKRFVQPELDKAAVRRVNTEAELTARGVPIDLTYRDPPVPSLR